MKYKSLPVMQCDDGCGECCGPVFCKPEEFRAVVEYAAAHGIEPVRQGITCPFYQGGVCTVHPVRPWVCRLFGHVPSLTCCKGYNANVTPAAERALNDWYEPRRATACLLETCHTEPEIIAILEAELI